MPIYIPKIKVRSYSISEMLTIKEYWNLIGWKPFSAITWEPGFSQVCSFRRIVMNHRNFHFTQIPEKTNDVIFLKSPETMFLGHFCPMGFFSKKSGSVTYNYIWALNTMLSFRKNYKRKGRPYFIGSLRRRPGVQKEYFKNNHLLDRNKTKTQS